LRDKCRHSAIGPKAAIASERTNDSNVHTSVVQHHQPEGPLRAAKRVDMVVEFGWDRPSVAPGTKVGNGPMEFLTIEALEMVAKS
jgi:hypothetical protein